MFWAAKCDQSYIAIMRKQNSGHIFNVSSLGAYNVGPLSGPYCATKHAVKALSETLAMEVKQFGIHVTDVKPGFMRTEFFGTSHKTDIAEQSPYKTLSMKIWIFIMDKMELKQAIQRKPQNSISRLQKWIIHQNPFQWEQIAVMEFGKLP